MMLQEGNNNLEHAPVWGCAWNLRPFSWAMKKTHHFDWPIIYTLKCPNNPAGLSANCKVCHVNLGHPLSLLWSPYGLRRSKCSPASKKCSTTGAAWSASEGALIGVQGHSPRLIKRDFACHILSQIITIFLFSHTTVPTHTTVLGTDVKAAVFGNWRYWESYITYMA